MSRKGSGLDICPARFLQDPEKESHSHVHVISPVVVSITGPEIVHAVEPVVSIDEVPTQ